MYQTCQATTERKVRKMTKYCKILLVTFAILIAFAFGEKNIRENNKINPTDENNESDCDEMETWETLYHNSRPIKGVCILRDYQVNDRPIREALTPVLIYDHMTKISAVNEETRTLELDVVMGFIWEDARIKSHFSDKRDIRKLPSITKYDDPFIWLPPIYIQNLKSLSYLNDPIKFNWITLLLSRPDSKVFPHNKTLIYAAIEWHVTICCEFDFSKYPLDDQACEFLIRLYDSNITRGDMPWIGNSRLSKNAVKTHGYEATKIDAPPTLGKWPMEILIEYGDLRYEINLKRIKTPYLYQYYLPCASIVFASCLSFIVPISAIPGRIALVVTQFLTLTNLFINQKVGNIMLHTNVSIRCMENLNKRVRFNTKNLIRHFFSPKAQLVPA